MKDTRNSQLANVIVNHSLDVKKDDKIVISTSDLDTADLMNSCMEEVLKNDAQVYLDVMGFNWLLDRSSAADSSRIHYENASLDKISNPPTIYKEIMDWGDKFIRLTSFSNYTHLSGIDADKIKAKTQARSPWFNILLEKPWVLTYFPTDAMAQLAGMSTEQLTDFYFEATLIDYDNLRAKEIKVKDLLDKSTRVHLVGEKTDIWIGVEGRLSAVSYGKHNLPDGEVFIAPKQFNVEGEVYFDLPNFKEGVDVVGANLKFQKGKVVEYTAEQGEDMLSDKLNIDEGAKYVGELGLGFNYGIKNVMRSTIFDEKIGGTIHMAVGHPYKYKEGGAPEDGHESAIHWDLVKDMRKSGSFIEFEIDDMSIPLIWTRTY